jgi:amino acid transporter
MAGRYHRNGRTIRTRPRNPLSTDEINAITGGFKTAGAINPPTSLPEVLMVADATQIHYDNGEVLDKGLKGGALGLISSIVIGVASTAPAYSLAATLGFVAILAGTQTVIVVILAFVPIFLISFGYKELNRREPDCGTTFTWGTKAFGPKTGWMGGWGILAADILVMASLSQVAGQYFFLLVGAHGIGGDATSGWVLLVGVIWIVLMTWICYVGIEISANIQKVLLAIEVVMLAVFSITAIVKTYGNNAPAGSSHISASWFNPAHMSVSHFVQAILLMLFIYWGWDSAVSVNEETADKEKTPGRAAVISTILLVAIYTVVAIAVVGFAGVGSTGNGLTNSANSSDVISILGSAAFGAHGAGLFFSKLLVLMVLTSAAASTQTTILPTARTSLAMAAYKAIPKAFAKIHPRYLTPSVSTLAMGGVSIVLYVVFNFLAAGNIIPDSVTALGWMIAFYYGLTGFECAWYYRRDLRNSSRDLWVKGIVPLIGGVLLFAFLVYDIWLDWNPVESYTSWSMQFSPHWDIGGVFIIGVLSFIVGLVLMAISIPIFRPFFRGEVMSPEPELASHLKND